MSVSPLSITSNLSTYLPYDVLVFPVPCCGYVLWFLRFLLQVVHSHIPVSQPGSQHVGVVRVNVHSDYATLYQAYSVGPEFPISILEKNLWKDLLDFDLKL